jgi:flagellar biosynthetic protein FlhB
VSEDQDQKRFDPTPKRIKDFRKRGQIALSKDLSQVGALIGSAAIGLGSITTAQAHIGEAITRGLRLTDEPAVALEAAALTFAMVVGPIALGALAGWLVVAAVELGAPPAFAPFKFDLTRLANPSAILELVSPKKAGERGLKAVAKLAVVAAAAVIALSAEWDRWLSTPVTESAQVAARATSALAHVTLWSCAALLTLAIVDYALARRRNRNEMKMTMEELRRENKENDGDPAIKRRRRQRMRELAKRRFVAAVRSSDVVLVNPTEYAVALRYKSNKDPAPRVVAKGKDKVAERIRERARESGVPIVVNIPLARLLHKIVPEGRVIPTHVFRAVAEVLGYVYRLRGRRPR